jgi:hypothetical protein
MDRSYSDCSTECFPVVSTYIEPKTSSRSSAPRLRWEVGAAGTRSSSGFRTRQLVFPLPEGEGQGEGEGNAAKRNSWKNCVCLSWFPFPLTDVRRRHRSAIVRQRMGGAFLQGPPNRISNAFLLATQPRIPEAQHLDSARFQPGVSFRIFRLLFRRAVLEPVQFDVQPRFQAEEVQYVRPERVLSPKLVAGETPVTKPSPEEFLSPGVLLAQHACDASELERCHADNVGWTYTRSQARGFAEFLFPLTPALSPREREHRAPPLDDTLDGVLLITAWQNLKPPPAIRFSLGRVPGECGFAFWIVHPMTK